MIGAVCDISYGIKSTVIPTYYHALKNLYGEVRLVSRPEDLDGLTSVFVGNDHFGPHRNIWCSDWFLNKCNTNNIQVILIGAEKICNSPYYKSAVEMHKQINRFNRIVHYVWDVEDSIVLNKKILGYSLSRHYSGCVDTNTKKHDRCVFIGNWKAEEYKERREILSKVRSVIPVDVIDNFQGDWKEYLQVYANYRFVFSPLTWGNAINYRFYESIFCKSIPIQQVRSYSILDHYPEESKFKDCIFFENINELPQKISNISVDKCESMIWMEDKIQLAMLSDGVFL